MAGRRSCLRSERPAVPRSAAAAPAARDHRVPVRERGRRHHDLHRQDLARLEAEVHTGQLQVAAAEQCDADEQRDSEASSATTTASRSRVEPRDAPARAPLISIARRSWRRCATRGASPIGECRRHGTASAAPATRTSSRSCTTSGRCSVCSARRASPVSSTSSQPAAPPASAMTAASAKTCRASRALPAPSAARTAKSRARRWLRTSSRFERLTETMSRMKPAPASSSSSAGRAAHEQVLGERHRIDAVTRVLDGCSCPSSRAMALSSSLAAAARHRRRAGRSPADNATRSRAHPQRRVAADASTRSHASRAPAVGTPAA
jgi:hypothetical protein